MDPYPQTKEELENYISSGGDLNIITKNGGTLLTIFISSKDIESVRLLLENKADPNIPNKDGNYPIHIAILKIYTTRLLLNYNSPEQNTNSMDHNEYVMFLNLILLLLENKADPNILNKCDDYPIHLASKCLNDITICQLLVDFGADIKAVNNRGDTILYSQCGRGNIDFVKWYLKHDINAKNANDSTPLHNSTSHPKILKLLLKSNMDFDALNNGGNTPLHISMSNVINTSNDNKCIELLLEAGAKINIKNSHGQTPLHLAVTRKKTDKSHLLLKMSNIDIHSADKEGDTPLHLATKNKMNEIVIKLLDMGAKQDILNKEGATPLHLATKNGMKEIVIKLLDMGADRSILNKRGKTAHNLAVESGNSELISIFDNYPSTVSLRTLCLRSIINGNVDTSNWPPLLFLQPNEIEENSNHK